MKSLVAAGIVVVAIGLSVFGGLGSQTPTLPRPRATRPTSPFGFLATRAVATLAEARARPRLLPARPSLLLPWQLSPPQGRRTSY